MTGTFNKYSYFVASGTQAMIKLRIMISFEVVFDLRVPGVPRVPRVPGVPSLKWQFFYKQGFAKIYSYSFSR